MQFFSLTQSKSGPDNKFIKQFTVRIKSKSNKIHHGLDPVQWSFLAHAGLITLRASLQYIRTSISA